MDDEMTNINEVLEVDVVLEVECVDRLYLNASSDQTCAMLCLSPAAR
jgi:hypothetical protein